MITITITFAAPIPDSSANEPGVIAPNGIPITLTPDANADYGNNYGGGSYSTSSMMMDDNTSTMMDDKTSTMMYETTTSTMMDETTTSTATYSTSTMYGSGYNNWNSGYDSCVQRELLSSASFR